MEQLPIPRVSSMCKCKTCGCPKNLAALAIFTTNTAMETLEAKSQTSSRRPFQPPRQLSSQQRPFTSNSGAKRKRFQLTRFQKVVSIDFTTLCIMGKCAPQTIHRLGSRSRRDLSARRHEVTSPAGSSIRLSWRTINAPQLAHQATTTLPQQQ